MIKCSKLLIKYSISLLILIYIILVVKMLQLIRPIFQIEIYCIRITKKGGKNENNLIRFSSR